MLDGLTVPDPTFVGGYRGEYPSAQLKSYDVVVDALPGVPCEWVNRQLRIFFAWLRGECASLDQQLATLPQGLALSEAEDTQLTAFDLEVLRVAAVAHGEWVRIHPFANGNGRVARMWIFWITSRYGLPALMPLRPRPPYAGYGDASRASMVGDHRPMRILLGQIYAASV